MVMYYEQLVTIKLLKILLVFYVSQSNHPNASEVADKTYYKNKVKNPSNYKRWEIEMQYPVLHLYFTYSRDFYS